MTDNEPPASPDYLGAIRAELARQEVTRAQLASRVHISATGLSRRLSGDTPMTVDDLLAIAAALDVPAFAFLYVPAPVPEHPSTGGTNRA